VKVLVIDDEAPIRLLCRVNLEAEGVNVIEASDGPTGIEAAGLELPDMILLDVMMPALDGLAVAQTLRGDSATRAIPIMFLSPRKEFCECVNFLRLHDIRALAEPFNPFELGNLVEDTVRKAAEPTADADLADLWALRTIATTPNAKSVDHEVAKWKRRLKGDAA
jgi:two-component system alkaline phosphatase synthesis response regulator PhoP